MKKYILLFIALLLPALLVLVYFFIFSVDGVHYSGVSCAFYQNTGLDCPGCGGQRALYHLLHGHILKALRYNVLFVIFLPVFMYMYYVFIRLYIFNHKKYENHIFSNPKFVFTLLGVIAIFFIFRNIPFTPFIYLNSHF